MPHRSHKATEILHSRQEIWEFWWSGHVLTRHNSIMINKLDKSEESAKLDGSTTLLSRKTTSPLRVPFNLSLENCILSKILQQKTAGLVYLPVHPLEAVRASSTSTPSAPCLNQHRNELGDLNETTYALSKGHVKLPTKMLIKLWKLQLSINSRGHGN